jgi:hypothetical protein
MAILYDLLAEPAGAAAIDDVREPLAAGAAS